VIVKTIKILAFSLLAFSAKIFAYDAFDVKVCEAFPNISSKIQCYQEIDESNCQKGAPKDRLLCFQQRAKSITPTETISNTAANYTIISDETKRNIKRSVSILLDEKVTKAKLSQIALSVKKRDSKSYLRIFIGYYLRGNDRSQGYWATTHFNPELEVKILGLSLEDESRLSRSSSKLPYGEIIGSWLDDRPKKKKKMTLFRNNGVVKLEYSYSDGSSRTEEMDTIKTSRGLKVQEKGGSDFGEYYLVTKNGSLEYWGRNGKFYTAKKLR